MQFLQGLQAEALELHPLHSSCSYSDLRGADVKLRCGSIYTHTAQLSVNRTQLKALSHPAHLSIQNAAVRLESCKSHLLYCLKTQCL